MDALELVKTTTTTNNTSNKKLTNTTDCCLLKSFLNYRSDEKERQMLLDSVVELLLLNNDTTNSAVLMQALAIFEEFSTLKEMNVEILVNKVDLLIMVLNAKFTQNLLFAWKILRIFSNLTLRGGDCNNLMNALEITIKIMERVKSWHPAGTRIAMEFLYNLALVKANPLRLMVVFEFLRKNLLALQLDPKHAYELFNHLASETKNQTQIVRVFEYKRIFLFEQEEPKKFIKTIASIEWKQKEKLFLLLIWWGNNKTILREIFKLISEFLFYNDDAIRYLISKNNEKYNYYF